MTVGLLAAPAAAPLASPADAGAASDTLRVGEVTLQRDPIFTDDEVADSGGLNRLLRRTMNRFHVDTRRGVIEDELLFRRGEVLDPDRLAETERNLRALGFLADVSVAPTDTAVDGLVPVLVRTRETWTLETRVSYSRSADGAQRWTLQLSDDNFLGRGVTVGGGLGEDEDSAYWNLWYSQRRLTSAGLILDLQYSDRDDGEIRRAVIGRPFYAQDDPWTAEVAGWDMRWEDRIYLSNAGPAGADPGRAASLHGRAPYRDRGGHAAFQLRLSPAGRGRVWRLGAGVRAQETRFALVPGLYGLSDGRRAELAWLLEDDRPLARRQGTTVFPYLWLRSSGRDWTKRTHLLQYGPIEDVPLGWDLDLKVGPAGGAVGSTAAWGEDRLRVEAIFLKWRPLLGGHAMLLASGEAETGRRGVRNHLYDVVGGWLWNGGGSAPWLGRAFGEYARGGGLAGSQALVLGLDRGLRTLDYDGMAGDRLVRWNLELGRATRWEPFGLFRLGLAAFYGGGGAWWRDESHTAADLRHEVGAGLRFGPTRSARSEVARIDLVVDTAGGGPVLTAVTGGYF